MEMPGKVNYLIGKDAANWHTNLPTYGEISYTALYPGINLLYSGTGGQLKGTYTLSPNANPDLIRWRYAGAGNTTVDAAGNLQITVPHSSSIVDRPSSMITLTEHAPQAWQEIGGQRLPVSSRYAIQPDGSIGFALGAYDRSQPLTIDPTLTYSTYLGGFYGDGAGSIALDAQDNIYVTGNTVSSDFPTAGTPYQPVWGGQSDAFVTKLSADGSTLIYSTFLGGGGEIDGGDFGDFISVDAGGNVIVAGLTDSDDFPVTQGAYQTIYGGTADLFVAKLNATGSDLIFATYYGNAGVEEPGGFTVDPAGNTYMTGYFFAGPDKFVFVTKLNATGSDVVFERSLGGHTPGPGDENANSEGDGIALDASGNIYVTGYTRAADFPVTSGAYKTSIEAFEDGFVTKLNPTGQTLIYSTYINGGVSEYLDDITVDAGGNAYVTGNTSSSDYPTTAGAFQTVQGDPRIAFVTKLNPAGSGLVYSTFLGSEEFSFDGEDYGFAIRVNGAGNAYVVGYTNSPGFPVANPLQATLRGPTDAFISKFNPAGSALDFSTFLGGASGDGAGGIVLDDTSGKVYIAGSTTSIDFPVVNAVQPTSHGNGDAFIAIISDGPGSSPTPTVTGTPPTATATASATACVASPNYRFLSFSGATLVPGTTDVGNHCEDCTTAITLPFPIKFYGQSFSTANVSSNGNIQFLSNDEVGLTECAPYDFFNYAIAPYQADLNTEAGGIYTSVTGSAPNRILNIEWRACVYDPIKFECNENINFEARLYENSPVEQIDFVYGQVDSNNGIPASVLLQEGFGSHLTEYSCNQAVLDNGLLIQFTRNTCASPTATVTGTPPTATPTRTALPPTPTADPCHNLTSWRVEPTMPVPFARSAAAVVNDKLYVIGGASNSPTPVRYTQRFDPVANSWATASPLPNGIGVAYSQAAGVGNKIYMVGDTFQPYESFIEIYDTATDSWSRAATLPEPLASGGLAAYNGKIYLFGGQVVNQPGSTHVYMYDPAANTFTAKAPMPSGQFEIGAATVGNRIYVVGGYQYIHYAYDPAADSWSTIASPPTPNFSVPGVFSFSGELWVTTGRDNPSRHGYPPSQEIQIYNPTTNQWRFGPALNVPRYYSTAVGVINGRAYIVGGIDLNSETYPYVYLSSMESIAYASCGTGTPAPTMTGTATRTTTVVATPTLCPIQFSDVPEGSTFYAYVRCLACNGILGGYDDGTFRPNNEVTRGQIAKIVSNAASLYDDPGEQIFEDVPTSNTFYTWVNRLALRGYMSGYPCGAEGEPCGVDNMPYFRPFNSATRGQLAKIVSNAAGLNGTPTGIFYTDVQPDNPFYLWIMRLTDLSVMSGYPCGGDSEPCDDENRPYFRPYNSVTRGQASKIVANTFFPGCSVLKR
jgi:N-acetylneuraminic acid mutarotase